jgi:hypothetical protein
MPSGGYEEAGLETRDWDREERVVGRKRGGMGPTGTLVGHNIKSWDGSRHHQVFVFLSVCFAFCFVFLFHISVC